MATFMNMPKIGVNMTDGTVTEWYVKEGDKVTFGEMALNAETDKDIQDIPADQTGIVLKIIAQVGDNVKCHEPLAIVGQPNENIDALLAQLNQGQTPQSTPSVDSKQAEAKNEAAKQAVATNQKVPISPLAKKIAKEKGLDINVIPYKGARITKADVLSFVPSSKQVNSTNTPVNLASQTSNIPYTGIRKKIGDRLTTSVLTKPWAALSVAVDMTKMIEWRASLNDVASSRIGYNVLFAKATARALQAFPLVNSHLAADGNEIVVFEDVNIGIAVNTDRGLMVPVLNKVASKGVLQLSQEYDAVVERTLSQTNQPNDLLNATFTISNLGARGLTSFRAVINPPECAILAVAAIIKTPVVIDDQIVIRPMVNLTLSFDHRMIDGDYAAAFLQTLQSYLEDPMRILL